MPTEEGLNLALPGNPRYQPKELQAIFGYDRLYWGVAQIEIALLKTLAEIGVIPPEEIALLTPEVEARLLAITSTAVKRVEDTTRHDILAWKEIAREIVPAPLNRWLHVFLTSYDAIGPGMVLHYRAAHRDVIVPGVQVVVRDLVELVRRYADLPQIGRTHGQHATPITVGFWLATLLQRVVTNADRLHGLADQFTGKITGPVGASNAVVALGIPERCGDTTFEARVLNKVGLTPSRISTQILPPEPIAYYLHAVVMLTAAFGQLGRDCRQLARTEIAEITQNDGSTSSAMAHKQFNPITYENMEGMWLHAKNFYGLVWDALISEHQRDLVNSSLMRSWPAILVFLQVQLEALQRKRHNQTFLQRLNVNAHRCAENLKLKGGIVASEALYVALIMAGYQGNAHELVHKGIAPRAELAGCSIADALGEMAFEDQVLSEVVSRIPPELIVLLRNPEEYTGNAAEKAREITNWAEVVAKTWLPS